MGLRFRKSIKIAPGVKVNFGKKSSSVTIGPKGAHYTVSSTGRRTKSVGIPGTGLSYTTSSGGKSRKTRGNAKSASHHKEGKSGCLKPILIFFGIAFFLGIVGELFSCGASEDAEPYSIQEEQTEEPEANGIEEEINSLENEKKSEDISAENKEDISQEAVESEPEQADDPKGENINTEESMQQEELPPEQTTMYATSNLKIRSGAGTNYDSIGTLNAGDEITVMGISDGWATIIASGVTAYVSADYLSESPVSVQTSKTTQQTTPQNNSGNSQPSEQMVWIPQSGSKYHSRSGCSGMDNPRQVTLSEAESMGYTPCKRCH